VRDGLAGLRRRYSYAEAAANARRPYRGQIMSRLAAGRAALAKLKQEGWAGIVYVRR
jgi:hypothetical protein